MPRLAPDNLKPVRKAAEFLTEKLGRGYSKDSINRRILNGEWKLKRHYFINHAGCRVIDCDRVIQDLRSL